MYQIRHHVTHEELMLIFFNLQGDEVIFCLYVPENSAKDIKSIELLIFVDTKTEDSKELKRNGTMWKTSIVFLEPNGEIVYNYKLKIKKKQSLLYVPYFSSPVDEVMDKETRSVCWGIIQRDILSITSMPFEDNDKNRGIAAHIKDILQNMKISRYEIQTAFLQVDNLMSRYLPKYTIWNGFTKIFEGQITQNECLLFLHCTQRNWVELKDMNIATNVWKNIQHLDKKLKDVCIMYVGEIFQIYEASSRTQCSPLHFINDTESLLDVPSLHKVLHSRSFPVHNCSESLSCLQRALKFILKQNEESEKLQELLCLLFDCIPEQDVLEGILILKKINTLDEKRTLIENTQKHVKANAEKIFTRKVKFSNLRAIYEIISKAEGDLRIALVFHYEMEIVSQITNPENFRCLVGTDLEDLCEEMLFQTIDQQILLLKAVLKNPLYKTQRQFIKFVLTHFQNTECESAKETIEKAYEVLLSTCTVPELPLEKRLISYFKEYDSLSNKLFFQSNRDHFKRRFQSHVSTYSSDTVLTIHADVENLQKTTIDLYCHLLKDKLKNQTFLTKSNLVEKHWKSLDTR